MKALAGSVMRRQWVVVAASLLLLYAPTVWDLAHGLWQDSTHSHGPLVLLATVWLFARVIRQPGTHRIAPAQPRPWAGGISLGLGLVLYVLGRSQAVYVLEVGSAIPLMLGCVLLLEGVSLARRLWFAFVFMIFLVPLPGSLIDTLTQPMKLAVSWGAEHVMYALGYPVARSGVVLGIGPYQLFVADACAGLNSLFMLEAFGLLYLNVIRHESVWRNGALAVLIVPISFVANVVRVVILALVTFHFGDAAGQGFIHSFSGAVLFAAALGLTVAADVLMRILSSQRPDVALVKRGEAAQTSPVPPARHVETESFVARSTIPLSCAVLAAIAAFVLSPRLSPVGAPPHLERLLPERFGQWEKVVVPYVPVGLEPVPTDERSMNRPYDQSVVAAYSNAQGEIVTLALAYAAAQRQEVKIHQPELCYVAQGFQVRERQSYLLQVPSGTQARGVLTVRMHAESSHAREAVNYWLRVGSSFVSDSWQGRWLIFQAGLRGEILDGLLVRASTPVGSTVASPAAHELNDRFLLEFATASTESARALILGGPVHGATP